MFTLALSKLTENPQIIDVVISLGIAIIGVPILLFSIFCIGLLIIKKRRV